LSTVNHEVRILHPNHYDQGPKVMYKETQQYKSMVVLSMLSDMEHKTNKKKFEDTKGVIRIRTSETADDAMANRKRKKRQIMIYKLYNNVQI
jgi:hypothetical protein